MGRADTTDVNMRHGCGMPYRRCLLVQQISDCRSPTPDFAVAVVHCMHAGYKRYTAVVTINTNKWQHSTRG